MKTRAGHRPLLAAATIALATGLSACHHADSILLVEVAGDLAWMPASLAVAVTPGQMPRKDLRIMPPGGAVVSLPASFTVELPGTLTGPITIDVQALDTYGLVLAEGTVTQRDLNVGGQTVVVVMLHAASGVPITPPDAGGGVDAATSDAARSDGGRIDAAASDALAASDASGHGNGGKP